MKKESTIQKNKGAAMMIVVFFFMFISLTILIGIVTPVVREFKIASDNYSSKQSYFIAESGAEDLVYRIKNNMETGTMGDNRTLFLNNIYTTIPMELTDIGGGRKQIIATGNVNSNERTVGLTLTTTTGTSFNYGVQSGIGGVYLDSGTINGNVYSNGPITASSSGGNIITGTAISANSPSAIFDQSNGTGIPAYNISFGNNDSTQDVAQSFMVSSSSALNKVQLYLKSSGSPSDAIVKIVNDSSNKPGSTVIASGPLSASKVTSSYNWIDVSFTTNPVLNIGTKYWLVIDASTSSRKYYIIGASNGGYGNGVGNIGQSGGTWNNTTPSGLDYYFNLYLGGPTGSITGYGPDNQVKIGTISGSAQAHTVSSTTSSGNIYCAVGISNNKPCLSQPDPVYIAYPVSDGNLNEWKDAATAGGQYNGNYSVGPWPNQNVNFGPKKIVGDLTVSNGGTLNITGTLWVTGNLVLDGGGLIKLASSFGSNDAVIVVNGTISISGGGHATGSGVSGSYIMLYTTDSSDSAATINGGAGAVIIYAPNGTINVSGGASLKEATGNKLNITGGSSITYESGLANNNFSSGPSGSWGIDSWGESQ